jgi:hypothetical protein
MWASRSPEVLLLGDPFVTVVLAEGVFGQAVTD